LNAALKLAAFAAVLALLAGGGAIAGATLGPDRDSTERPKMAGHGEDSATATAETSHGEDGGAATAQTGHGEDGGAHGEADAVRGLATAQDGLRLELRTPELRRGADERLVFAITGDDGRPVEDLDVTHTKRMHVIVVRRDLTGFQHLHPKPAADGTWTAPLRLDAAGSYRVFADFSHDGEARTLASDLRVDGPADLRPLPEPAATARTADGDDVELTATGAHPGQEAELRFAITRNGRPVATEPYLGADGHLVALREGDLAFLHVHPEGDRFMATFPTEGRYRLFLQFKADGRVRTAAFTQEVSR